MFFSCKTKLITFEIPRDQYNALVGLFESAQEADPNFKKDEWFSDLIGDWLVNNWRGTVKKMVQHRQDREQKNKRRVPRK
ncbi:hypothetical protein JCM14036_02650 [Desulfotomaculum defluvii]